MPRPEEEQAARLLERLLTDSALRARFRSDPAGVAREAGVEDLVAQDFSGSAMSTLEVRESRSSLAGVLMAAALEGFAGFGLANAQAAGARDLTPNVDRWVAGLPPGNAAPLPGNGAPAGGSGLATPEGVAAEQASWQQQGPWTARSAGNAAGLAQPQPGANAAALPVAPAPNGGAAANAEQLVGQQPQAKAAAFTPPDPTDYGMAGTGGKPTAEALALLENKNVKFLDAAGPKDLRSGRMDPRVVDVVTQLAADHRITLSALTSNHDKLTAGGGVSNHWYGRAVDVAGVDGQAVNSGNAAARAVAESLQKLPESIRPTEVGSPWQISAPGYFSDAAHQNHIHIGFDNAITPDWKPPDGSAAPPSSSDAGVFPVVDPTSAPASDPAAPVVDSAPAPASAQPAIDPASVPDGPDQPDGSQDTNPATGLEDPGGDTNAQADQESDGTSVGDDEGEGDSSGGSDGEDANDESDSGDDGSDSSDSSDGGGGAAPAQQPAAPAPAAPAPAVAPVVLDDTGLPPLDSSATPPVDETTTPASGNGGGAVDNTALAVDGGGGGVVSYPGDNASRTQIAAWMSSEARRRGLPPELPVMASLVESGMKNLSGGDRDSVGFFQMRVGIWNNGAYAGYPDKPELQLKWFLDKAVEVKKQRVAQGQSVSDPNQYGEWVADVERPAEQYRGRYQLQYREARSLLAAAGSAPAPSGDGQAGGGHLLEAAAPTPSSSGGGGGGARAAELALKEVGTRETGNNAGGAEKYQRTFGGSAGQSWCGYFVGTMAKAAGAQGLNSRVAYVPNIITDGKAGTNGFVSWTTDPRRARPGDFVVLFGGAHVEIVESVNKDGSVNSVGGNTSLPSGGEGVAKKTRTPGDIVGFARPNYGGGNAA